jgi:hypothetical protein
MALERNKITQFNLGVVVGNAVDAVRTIRAQESSRKESLFQQAVADGLSYDAQVAFREEQLKASESESFPDQTYIGKIKESISSTKRLSRFNNYRTKYSQALGELNDGQINAIAYRDKLKTLLATTDDPDLRLEIQNNITAADTAVTQYKNTILSNQVKRAQYDGTQKTIKKTIDSVKEARTRASINGNDDEVSEYDATLAALNSQLVQVKSEDVINDMTARAAISSSNSKEKLNSLNSQIQDADSDTPIVIGGKKYASEQQYWTIVRNSYLNGSGSGIFSDYFGELQDQYKTKIDGDVAKFGFVPANTIQTIKGEFDALRSRPEIQPFLERLDSLGNQAVSSAVGSMASAIVDRAGYSGDFTQADTSLKTLASSYGVDTSGYQLQLGNSLNQQVNAAIAAGEAVPPEASLLPGSDFAIPSATPTTPSSAPKPGQSTGSQNLDIITDNVTGRSFARDLSVAGSTYQPYTAPTQSTPAPAAPAQAPIAPVNPKPVAPVTPKAPAPVAPIAAVVPPKPMTETVPVKPAAYKGSSITDYLTSKGQDSSVTNRARLAREQGLVKTDKEYLDLAAQGNNAAINTALLKRLSGI